MFFAVFLILSTAKITQQINFYRTFECVKNQCQRTNEPISFIDPLELKRNGHHSTLAACRLVCGDYGSFWPIPTGPFTVGKTYIPTHPNNIHFNLERNHHLVRSFLTEIQYIFIGNLQSIPGKNCKQVNSSVTIHINVETEKLDLDWHTQENYILQVLSRENNVDVFVGAPSVYGARHALETLLQLFAPIIMFNDVPGLVIVDQAKIEDQPIYVHRGLLIDTARNFLPVASILRTIDGLAATKMNVLHWHATDTQSFPLQIKSRPMMSMYGAYSPEMVYSLDEMENIQTYARYRGVRVIIELDSPSHAGSGWEWGESQGLGNLAVCIDKEPWREFCIQPPCGQLNPVNPKTLDVLQDIYMDTLSALGYNSIIHLGGDEVFLPCWNSTEEIVTEMKNRGMSTSTDDFLKLWGEFHNKQLSLLDEIKGKKDNVILWSSGLTAPGVIEKHLDKSRFVIQTWLESSSTIPNELLELDYRLVISTKNTWYLDHGFWGTTKYHSWRDAYNNRIPRSPKVLGGEACMWGEYVNDGSLDSKVWPRAAAVGERLWSDPSEITIEAEPRLQAHRERLETRQIHADAMTPAWCAQHAQKCS